MKQIPHSRPSVGPLEQRAVARVLGSGRLTQGAEVERFEIEMAKTLGLRAGAAVSSGTTGLELALRATQVGSGHEVLMPTYVCSALWHAVRRVGAEPVLVDCEAAGLNLSIRDAARKKTRRTRAIIVAHMFGVAADIKDALKLGIAVIEDCAQSLGARLKNRPLGGFGDLGVLSFYATKLLATGEGGMVVSKSLGPIERIRSLREYDGRPPAEIRENAKLTDMQAAMGRVQLKRLAYFLRRRRELARAYDKALEDLPIALPPRQDGRVYHRYILRASERIARRLLEGLNRMGIAARRPVYRPLHWDVSSQGTFPEADRAWRECVSLPIYPDLSARDQRRIVRSIRKILKA